MSKITKEEIWDELYKIQLDCHHIPTYMRLSVLMDKIDGRWDNEIREEDELEDEDED